jgi:hypothetical protein
MICKNSLSIVLTFLLILVISIEISNSEVINVTVAQNQPLGCTIFSISIGDTVFFGNNEDGTLPFGQMFISFVPPQKVPTNFITPDQRGYRDIYGQVFVGFIYNDCQYVEGGMNDQGLCFDVTHIPMESVEGPADAKPWNHPLGASWNVLWVCSTVEEVIEWYQTHELLGNWNAQYQYCDAKGDAVVVTPSNGKLHFVEMDEDNYLITTNFNRVNVNSHLYEYPCWRYDTACEMLEEIENEENLTVETCRDILDATEFEGGIFNNLRTLYSTIYNPVTTEIYLYFRNDFETAVAFDLEEEYAKVDPGETDDSLQYLLAHKTYLMQEFFPEKDDEIYGPLAIILGLLGFGIGALILILRKTRTRRS